MSAGAGQGVAAAVPLVVAGEERAEAPDRHLVFVEPEARDRDVDARAAGVDRQRQRAAFDRQREATAVAVVPTQLRRSAAGGGARLGLGHGRLGLERSGRVGARIGQRRVDVDLTWRRRPVCVGVARRRPVASERGAIGGGHHELRRQLRGVTRHDVDGRQLRRWRAVGVVAARAAPPGGSRGAPAIEALCLEPSRPQLDAPARHDADERCQTAPAQHRARPSSRRCSRSCTRSCLLHPLSSHRHPRSSLLPRYQQSSRLGIVQHFFETVRTLPTRAFGDRSERIGTITRNPEMAAVLARGIKAPEIRCVRAQKRSRHR